MMIGTRVVAGVVSLVVVGPLVVVGAAVTGCGVEMGAAVVYCSSGGQVKMLEEVVTGVAKIISSTPITKPTDKKRASKIS